MDSAVAASKEASFFPGAVRSRGVLVCMRYRLLHGPSRSRHLSDKGHADHPARLRQDRSHRPQGPQTSFRGLTPRCSRRAAAGTLGSENLVEPSARIISAAEGRANQSIGRRFEPSAPAPPDSARREGVAGVICDRVRRRRSRSYVEDGRPSKAPRMRARTPPR